MALRDRNCRPNTTSFTHWQCVHLARHEQLICCATCAVQRSRTACCSQREHLRVVKLDCSHRNDSSSACDASYTVDLTCRAFCFVLAHTPWAQAFFAASASDAHSPFSLHTAVAVHLVRCTSNPNVCNLNLSLNRLRLPAIRLFMTKRHFLSKIVRLCSIPEQPRRRLNGVGSVHASSTYKSK